MPTRPIAYHRPKDRQAALELLRRTDLNAAPLVTGPRATALAEREVEAAVDLSQLGLDYVTEGEDGTIRIGAMTPLETLAHSELLLSRAGGLLAKAAHNSASAGLRRLATLGGTILSADSPTEVHLALLALDAALVVQTEEVREIRLTEFLAGGAELAEGQLLIEARFTAPSDRRVGGALERVARTPKDQAIVAVAAVIESDGEICRHARVAVAGAGPHPARLPGVEDLLEGQELSAELLTKAAQAATSSVNPISDHLGSAEYRREMAGALVCRALDSLRR